MSLFEMAYPQESLTAQLAALDVLLDGTITLPWPGNQIAIMDENRNITGYATKNDMGGMDFTDEMMRSIGSSTSNSMGGENIMDENFQNVGFTSENVHGGENLHSPEANLETITFGEGTNGEEVYTSDMELLGVSNEQLGEIHYSGFNESSEFVEDFPSFDSLYDFVGSSFDEVDFGSDFTSLDFDFGIGEEALNIFDFF